MGITYLLDTNIISEQLRAVPNAGVLYRLEAAERACAISSVTWHEIQYGVLRLPKSTQREALEMFAATIEQELSILPYDKLAATWFAQERARLTQIGLTPPYADGQIAAVAATNNLILVTHNEKDFRNFEQLRIENWFV